MHAINCTSLTDVCYGSTEDDWNAIDFSDDNEPLLNATIHYVIGLRKASNGNWYYYVNGVVQSSYTDIAKHSTGSQWYVKKGKAQTSYTGKVTYNGKTYNIVKGKVA
ncbi:MAG: hypothetical protein LUC87_00425 [Clostridiales bacterium]|nr:hypothetical protein [Clostridiales bacterium]